MISKATILKAMLSQEFEEFLQKKQEPKRYSMTRDTHRQFKQSLANTRPNSQEFYKRNKLSIQMDNAQSHKQLLLAKNRTDADQDKFKTRQYWRNLMRWQGFDDYMYLRDPTHIAMIKGRETLTKNDIVEPLISANSQHLVSKQFNAEDGIKDFQDQQRRIQMQQIKKMYEPGEANYQKFNPWKYKESFITKREKNKIELTVKQNDLVMKICGVLDQINERIINEEITSISPLGERVVRMLWKFGCLNLFLMGCYIHNMILQVYGKERVAYQNWKKLLRICNMQGNEKYKYKLVSYKHISKILIKLQQYDKSLIYLKKMLKLSWIVDDTNFELFTYDKISLCYYYKQDMDKAIFYHEKFAQGEFEPQESGMRMVGEQAYLLGAKLKEGLLNQHSYSEDEFDLETLLQKGNLSKWETENRRKELKNMVKKLPIEYKKGHSFGKISRSQNEGVVDFKSSMLIMNRFQSKHSTPLGPVFTKIVEKEGNKFKKNDQVKSCQYLFNQKSTNRVAQNFLLQEEIKEQPQVDIFSFKPNENVFFIKKMIRVFQYDIQYFAHHLSLFKNSTDALL